MKKLLLAILFTCSLSTLAVGQQPALVLPQEIPPVSNTSAGSSLILSVNPSWVYSVYVVNMTTTAGFLQLYNTTTVPSDNATVSPAPFDCAPLPANGVGSISLRPGPAHYYNTGVVAVVSSNPSCFGKTTGTITAFISGDVTPVPR